MPSSTPVAPLTPGPAAPVAHAPARPSAERVDDGGALLVIAMRGHPVFPSVPATTSRARRPAHANPVRFTLTLPDETEIADGAQFAVSAEARNWRGGAQRGAGQQRLWIRRLQSLEWRELPRTDGASFPFWSPDGRHIGFFADRSLKRIDVSNDLTQTVCDASSGRGGTWGTQGVIVFADADGLFACPGVGRIARAVTQVDEGADEMRASVAAIPARWPPLRVCRCNRRTTSADSHLLQT